VHLAVIWFGLAAAIYWPTHRVLARLLAPSPPQADEALPPAPP